MSGNESLQIEPEQDRLSLLNFNGLLLPPTSLNPVGDRVITLGGKFYIDNGYTRYALTDDELAQLEVDLAQSLAFDPETTSKVRNDSKAIARSLRETCTYSLSPAAHVAFSVGDIGKRVFYIPSQEQSTVLHAWHPDPETSAVFDGIENHHHEHGLIVPGVKDSTGGIVIVHEVEFNASNLSALHDELIKAGGATGTEEERLHKGITKFKHDRLTLTLAEEIVHLAQDQDIPTVVAEVLAKYIKLEAVEHLASQREGMYILASPDELLCRKFCEELQDEISTRFPGQFDTLKQLSFGTLKDAVLRQELIERITSAASQIFSPGQYDYEPSQSN